MAPKTPVKTAGPKGKAEQKRLCKAGRTWKEQNKKEMKTKVSAVAAIAAIAEDLPLGSCAQDMAGLATQTSLRRDVEYAVELQRSRTV